MTQNNICKEPKNTGKSTRDGTLQKPYTYGFTGKLYLIAKTSSRGTPTQTQTLRLLGATEMRLAGGKARWPQVSSKGMTETDHSWLHSPL